MLGLPSSVVASWHCALMVVLWMCFCFALGFLTFLVGLGWIGKVLLTLKYDFIFFFSIYFPHYLNIITNSISTLFELVFILSAMELSNMCVCVCEFYGLKHKMCKMNLALSWRRERRHLQSGRWHIWKDIFNLGYLPLAMRTLEHAGGNGGIGEMIECIWWSFRESESGQCGAELTQTGGMNRPSPQGISAQVPLKCEWAVGDDWFFTGLDHFSWVHRSDIKRNVQIKYSALSLSFFTHIHKDTLFVVSAGKRNHSCWPCFL